MYSLCGRELVLTSIEAVSTLSDQEVEPIMDGKRTKYGNQRGGKEEGKKEGKQAAGREDMKTRNQEEKEGGEERVTGKVEGGGR